MVNNFTFSTVKMSTKIFQLFDLTSVTLHSGPCKWPDCSLFKLPKCVPPSQTGLWPEPLLVALPRLLSPCSSLMNFYTLFMRQTELCASRGVHVVNSSACPKSLLSIPLRALTAFGKPLFYAKYT